MNLRVGQTISEDRGHEPEGWTDYIRGRTAGMDLRDYYY